MTFLDVIVFTSFTQYLAHEVQKESRKFGNFGEVKIMKATES